MAEPNDSVILAGERAREMIIAAQAGFDPQQLKHDLTALGL
jgi:DNA-directed RNA polymerase subunit K/omega